MIEDTIKQSTNISEQNNFLDKPKDRNLTLDILRIIACFLVIVCHTYTLGFNKTEYNITWFLSVVIYLISKTAVPIFFMISGFLNLNKDYTYKEMIRKTIIRLVIPLLFFSALIYFKDNTEISIQNFYNFIIAFLQEDVMEHYWFMYALIGMYLITPIARKMIKNFEKKDYQYFIFLWILSLCIIPLSERFLGINITNRLPVITGYFGYYILGYYIFSKKLIKNKKYLLISIFSFIIVLIISTIITYIDCKNNEDYKYTVFLDQLNYLSIMIPTLSIVHIVRYIFDNNINNSKIIKFIIAVSSTTFGIYLTHGILLGKFKLLFNFMSTYIPNFIATIFMQVSIFICLTIVIYCIKKIPIIKNLL